MTMWSPQNADTLDADKKLSKVVNVAITDFPFFAVLLLQLKLEENDLNGGNLTMCTDGNKIMFNREFVEKLSFGELCFVELHEVMHVALGHLWRRGTREPALWNIATDFAVNAILVEVGGAYTKKQKSKSNQYVRELKLPKNCLYDEAFVGKSAEEIYDILEKEQKKQKNKNNGQGNGNGNDGGDGQPNNGGGGYTHNGKKIQAPSNHETWQKEDKSSEAHKRKQQVKWDGNLLAASEQLKSQGINPAGFARKLAQIKEPQKDWRVLLQEFIQEEFNDYSLTPPDKRYADSDFFLFDFNDTTEVVNDILFFVDTSGSMGVEEINLCYSEIQGAINQFNKHLHGTLLFFDAKVSDKYYNFDDTNGDISKLIPYGGGGTSFRCIFDFINRNHEKFDNINAVIILTDGFCDYPKESETMGLPVLWIYTTENNEPPFGRHTQLKTERN